MFMIYYQSLENAERLLAGNHTLRFVRDDIESNRFGERAALSNGNDIAFFYREGWRAVHGNVLVTLLETTVLGNVMQVVSSHNNRSLHFRRNDKSLKNTSSDRDITGEWALLVNVTSFDGARRCLDAETDVANETHGLLLFVTNGTLAGHKDGSLLLIGLFVLVALDILTGNTRHGGDKLYRRERRRRDV